MGNVARMGDEKCKQNFCRKTRGEEIHLGNLGVHERESYRNRV